jgi:hypothetical protein
MFLVKETWRLQYKGLRSQEEMLVQFAVLSSVTTSSTRAARYNGDICFPAPDQKYHIVRSLIGTHQRRRINPRPLSYGLLEV